MNFGMKITDGDRPLSQWLALRIQDDVKEKYGIDIKVNVG
jgi:hypothetical protein